MKDFQLLINKSIIGKIFFDETQIHNVYDLYQTRLVTQLGIRVWLENWWADPSSNIPEDPIYEIHMESKPIDGIPPKYPEKILLYKKENPENESDVFDEYIYVDGVYEKIGDFSIDDDLLPLVKFEDLNNFYDYLYELKTTINNNYKKSKEIVSHINGNHHKIEYNNESLVITDMNAIDLSKEEEILSKEPPKF